jgi:tetratricopeptide (TPR) repeat protein
MAEAESELNEALRIRQGLADDYPAVPVFRRRLADSHLARTLLMRVRSKPVEAEAEAHQAIALYRKLVADHPDVTDFPRLLAYSHFHLAEILSGAGRSDEAMAEYRQAMDLIQKLADDHPALIEDRVFAADLHGKKAEALIAIGKLAEAEAESRQELVILQQLADGNPTNIYVLGALARSYDALGGLLSRMGKPAEAEFVRAVAIRRKLVDDQPTTPRFQTDLVSVLVRLGRWHQAAGRWAQAGNDFRQVVAILEQLPRPTPENLYDLACYHALLSEALERQGLASSVAEGRAAGDQAMRRLREAVAAGFLNLAHMRADPDLDPLRSRLDFQLLMMDLSFPADPFAAAR